MTHEDKYALIVQLRERIAELEMANDNYKQMVVEQKQRIAELEAQLPEVVTPQMRRHVSGPYWLCNCATVLDGIARFEYCPYCGSKLNWEEI